MKIGMIGLGRMGGNMVRRWMAGDDHREIAADLGCSLVRFYQRLRAAMNTMRVRAGVPAR